MTDNKPIMLMPENIPGIVLAAQFYVDNKPYLRFWDNWDIDENLWEVQKELGLHSHNRVYPFMDSTFKGTNGRGAGLGVPIFYPKDFPKQIELYDAHGWVRVDEQHVEDIQSYLPKGIKLIKNRGKPFIQTI